MVAIEKVFAVANEADPLVDVEANCGAAEERLPKCKVELSFVKVITGTTVASKVT